jgi:hypothetical protein
MMQQRRSGSRRLAGFVCASLCAFAFGIGALSLVNAQKQSADQTNVERRDAEEAELVARLARIMVDEEREVMEQTEGSGGGVYKKVAPRGKAGSRASEDDDAGTMMTEEDIREFVQTRASQTSQTPPREPRTTKNPEAKFLYYLAKAFVRTARQSFPKEIAESDDFAMQARYQSSRCARSQDPTLSLDWLMQSVDELVTKEAESAGNHQNSRMYKPNTNNPYRPDMHALTTTPTHEEGGGDMAIEDLFLLRAKSYYYANREDEVMTRAAGGAFCGGLVGFSVASAIWLFAFFPLATMVTFGTSMVISAFQESKVCSAANCLYPRKCCDLSALGYDTCAYHFSICPDYCGHEGNDDGKRCDSGPPAPLTFRSTSPEFEASYEQFCCDGICCPTGFICCAKEDAVGKTGPKCEKPDLCIDHPDDDDGRKIRARIKTPPTRIKL